MATVEPKVDLRDLVLDAAERLLGRVGYQKMTMDDIAREAGVGKRTIYLHFTGKEDVALRTIDRIAGRVQADLALIAASSRTPSEKLRDMLRARVISRVDSVHDYYQSLDEILSALRPQFMERRRAYMTAEEKQLAAIIEDGVRRGDFRCPNPVDAARALLTATNALLPHGLSVRELGERDAIERRTLAIADLLIRGLQNKGETK